LSGYLITSLLVVERRTRGGIDLAAFWVRRARRLLPALLVLLVGVAVLLATYRRIVADHPGTLMIDLHGFVGQLELPAGEDVMRDFVHLTEPAADRVAAWMLPAVDAARRVAGVASPGA
jgi:hypothetical protein